VREDGKIGYADKATTLDAARARAGRLKAALESRAVHAEVLNYCRTELRLADASGSDGFQGPFYA